MLDAATLQSGLQNLLSETHFDELGKRESGKVRDSYRQGDRRLLVTTDRISAFDCILGTIPF